VQRFWGQLPFVSPTSIHNYRQFQLLVLRGIRGFTRINLLTYLLTCWYYFQLLHNSVHLVRESSGILQLDISDHPHSLRIGLQPIKQHPRNIHPTFAANFEEENHLSAGWWRPFRFSILVRILSIPLPNVHCSSACNDPLRRHGWVVLAKLRISVVCGQLLRQVTACKLLNN